MTSSGSGTIITSVKGSTLGVIPELPDVPLIPVSPLDPDVPLIPVSPLDPDDPDDPLAPLTPDVPLPLVPILAPISRGLPNPS